MRRKSLLSAILAGVALPATLIGAHDFTRVAGSDLDRIRGDVNRVGDSFRLVMKRENGKKAAASTRESS
ncbi:MAG: hypothetical protein J0H69_17080 [Burkholderiales bacterium]|nr:hypothetical protein [Burkholderiales bacterium]